MLTSIFRSNPEYQVVPLAGMTDAERNALGSLFTDPDCFAILRPRPGSGLRIKSICQQTALLLDTLGHGGRLPDYVARALGDEAERTILELVLDDIIQIQRDARFVSGAGAHDLLRPPSHDIAGLGRLARLSIEAVQHGQRLPIDDPLRLSAQIYFFNRVPVTPRWTRRIGDRPAFSRFLGLSEGGRCARLLRARWKRGTASPEMQGWLFWAMPGRGDRRPRADFKIYVSPTLEALPDLLPVILEVFAECGVRLFKIGADLPGLARPDKIVAYMDEFQQVEELGRQLASCLRDVPVHGVPFTAELSGDGLVSWGMDPHEGAVVDGQERPSWRLWITNRIAAALLDARQAGTRNVEPWRFALDRLRLDGVDVDAWTPTAAYHANLSR